MDWQGVVHIFWCLLLTPCAVPIFIYLFIYMLLVSIVLNLMLHLHMSHSPNPPLYYTPTSSFFQPFILYTLCTLGFRPIYIYALHQEIKTGLWSQRTSIMSLLFSNNKSANPKNMIWCFRNDFEFWKTMEEYMWILWTLIEEDFCFGVFLGVALGPVWMWSCERLKTFSSIWKLFFCFLKKVFNKI